MKTRKEGDRCEFCHSTLNRRPGPHTELEHRKYRSLWLRTVRASMMIDMLSCTSAGWYIDELRQHRRGHSVAKLGIGRCMHDCWQPYSRTALSVRSVVDDVQLAEVRSGPSEVCGAENWFDEVGV